jgi:hypothetical protein
VIGSNGRAKITLKLPLSQGSAASHLCVAVLRATRILARPRREACQLKRFRQIALVHANRSGNVALGTVLSRVVQRVPGPATKVIWTNCFAKTIFDKKIGAMILEFVDKSSVAPSGIAVS